MERDADPRSERARDGGDACADAPDAELPPGTLVGEYRVEGLLGRGGMGVVYGAVQPEIGARVAIKVLAAALSHDPRLGRRFVDEARAVNQIRHPNIVDIFSFGRLPDGRQYFVMEWLDGQTLAAHVARGPLPVSEARRLLLQICEALEAAHAARMVHRDLKPENLWIAAPRHGQPYAKILDFGIAKLRDNRDATTSSTEIGLALGTPCYMSPEQCRGEAVDHRTDIYAMGVVLYFMWAGRLPFEGQSFLSVVAQQITAAPPPPSTYRPVPARLERLILSCLEKDPALRPPSAKALGQALDAALVEALPGETLPGGAVYAPPPARRRGLRRRAVAGTTAVAAILAGAWLVTRARPALPARPARPAAAAAQPQPPAAAVAARPEPRPATAPVAAAPRPAAGEPIAQPAAPTRTPARARARRAAAPAPPTAAPPAPSKLDERGFLQENPFR